MFPFEGELSVDEARRAEAGRDFGRLVERVPRAVLYPRCAEDVVLAVQYARQHGLRIGARGQGHCTRGQALVEDGLVVDTRHLDSIEVGSGWAIAGSGCLWSALLRRTVETGQTPPTLTDYLDLSIGGTLSVGGVGGQSFRYGMQTDNVLALKVVTGTGELIECSARENADLFQACRGGLGQFGIIVAARVKLVPAPDRVVIYDLRYRDSRSFLADQELLVEDNRFDYVLGNVLSEAGGWAFSIELVKYLSPTASAVSDAELLAGLSFVPGGVQRREQGFFEYAHRLGPVIEQLKAAEGGRTFHPWMDLFVSADSVAALLDLALREIAPEQLTNGYVMTYPLVRGVCDTPFVQLPQHPHCFLFDILPQISAKFPTDLARFEDACRRVYDAARSLGVSVYPIGHPIETMVESDWRRQLGVAWDGLHAAKVRFDPNSVLTPGVRVFPVGAR